MEEKRLKYPIGTQDFATLREFGFIYVDKTDLIYELSNNSRVIFLARPRRFGKSLLLSTIRYYFEGRKDLFKGLAIETLEKDWEIHPVLLLELSRIRNNDPKSLVSVLEEQFIEWEKQYDITDINNLDFSQRFSRIIKSAYSKTGKRVVILIDEYDNPLINTLHNQEIYEANRNLLKSVYTNLKALDEYIRFAMLTGVSRFSKTSIFSGLNNLKDITFLERYETCCGFTAREIRQYLDQGVRKLGEKEGLDYEATLELLKSEYDGYHFSEKLTDMYNPFSLLNCLDESRISNYWIQSGVPEFLARRLEESKGDFQRIFHSEADESSLATVDTAFRSPVALMFQTGYLTIKGYDREYREYKLGIPNKEVDRGLFSFLLGHYTMSDPYEEGRELRRMSDCLKKGEAERFLDMLKGFMAAIPYSDERRGGELFFGQTMYVILHCLGFHVHSEFRTSRGRIDLLVETGDHVYVMELKLDGSAEEALDQIESREYALPWKYDGRKVYKIGINFSSQTRNITDWIIR